jgi:hypothetical protein
MAELHPALVEVLRADRDAFNGQFVQRQRAGSKIDGDDFQQHLRTTINDLVRDVAATYAERVKAVTHALYDISLDLFAGGLLGLTARHPHITDAWKIVLPKAMPLLARDPVLVVGCLSNAADHIAGFSSARPSEWIENMSRISPLCGSTSHWLDAGKILAWRTGLVQYRADAFSIARRLPWKLAATCFGANNATEADWTKQLDRTEADRWLAPNGALTEARPRIVRTTGGFRGFGGPCLRPPKVTAAEDELYVSDGVAAWKLLADACGTLWHRVKKIPSKASANAGVAVDPRGRVAWYGEDSKFDELAESRSHAFDGQTLAVTLPTSHHVFLVARSTG